ncbi:GNAT family N-acetyltransferase [Bacillus suaedaesalsae]|uniref:N-acetyltransferase n=1 Tax=Bacillus suaedaesalsae TaxID=2810349 RepID=A0ABS2DG42_9BACI|nr:N-acetyltransferase [Bacillus suaedaesalsae]MBM6617450.1 N-acetyltransferase [Bacillus suaedaesalsae]
MKIRTEHPHDHQEVFNLNYKAFGKREDESRLIERIRKSDNFIPGLSLVAELDRKIVGHLLISKATLKDGNEETEVLVLAPIAVNPEMQKSGIGSALIEEGLRRSKELEYGLVFLIGHPSYYPRFGFKPGRDYQFDLKQYNVPNDVFMVKELREGDLLKVSGELLYPESFFK